MQGPPSMPYPYPPNHGPFMYPGAPMCDPMDPHSMWMIPPHYDMCEICVEEPLITNRKSLNGPMTEEERGDLMRRRASSQGDFGSGRPASGLSRSGSFFSAGSRRGSLSRGTSSREFIYDMYALEQEEREVFKEYYGDMADRKERFERGGSKAIGHQRDVDGRYANKPRRSGNQKRSGYGGVSSHREIVMKSGGKWGDMELPRKTSTRRINIPVERPGVPRLPTVPSVIPVVVEETASTSQWNGRGCRACQRFPPSYPLWWRRRQSPCMC
ncbi:hypothetical protein DQ04_03991010 [Trypanosoma grayi]|uniref:hypothetical protein n=1 Tax=Trypanosoma grayi TaxID=71804 RepID=UPI0004F4A3E7|nr:hypothetical protein DQ04_03991010 [Trypanosoma grayi]KEG10244.1 hypothetical protein DQ04_03991010 [Trypanosoma grayi]